MTDNRTYAAVNKPLDDALHLQLTSLHEGGLEAGDEVLLWHAEPLLHVQSLDLLTVHTERTTDTAYFDQALSWSYDDAVYTPWQPAGTAALRAIPLDPASPLWLRFRFTRQGPPDPRVRVASVEVAGTRSFAGTGGMVTLHDEQTVVLRPEDTYKVYGVNHAEVYVKGMQAGTTVEQHFRYSTDNGRSWAPWVPLNDANLKATRFNAIRFSKFEFAFTKRGPGTPVVYDLELTGEFQNVTCGNRSTARLGLRTQCGPVGRPCGDGSPGNPMEWRPSENGCVAQYDPYASGTQVGLYNYIGNSVARQYGHDVDYFKCDPDEKGTDVLLHEHALYNVIDKKPVKAVVPDNQFPDGQKKFAHFDLSLLETFEVQITKDAYKAAFGPAARPGKNDILYFCKVNLLFQVDSVLAHRGPFNTELYYRLVLNKYNQKSNVSTKVATDDAQQALLAMTANTSLASLFGPQVNDELSKATKEQQLRPLTRLTNITVNPAVQVKPAGLQNSTVVVAANAYTIPVPLSGDAVAYGHADTEVGLGDNRAVSFWFKLAKYDAAWTYTFVNNRDAVLGYSVLLEAGQLVLNWNTQRFELAGMDVQPNVWYCFLANVDQRQASVELLLYSRGNEIAPQKLPTAELKLRNAVRHRLSPEQFTHGQQLRVGSATQPARRKTEFYLTNLRVYRQVLQDDARNSVLNSPIVKDADLLLLADNGDAKMVLPTAGNFS
jgi:hypothetical protein